MCLLFTSVSKTIFMTQTSQTYCYTKICISHHSNYFILFSVTEYLYGLCGKLNGMLIKS